MINDLLDCFKTVVIGLIVLELLIVSTFSFFLVIIGWAYHWWLSLIGLVLLMVSATLLVYIGVRDN